MKRILIACFAACTLLVAGGFAPKGTVQEVIVKKGKVKVNGVQVVPDWTMGPALKAIGETPRKRDGYNITHTFDNLGMVLFEPHKDKVASGSFSEFQIHFFVPEANNVTPTSGFVGKIKVDKLIVTSALTAAQMRKKLKGWKETESYLDHSYRMSSNGIYIYFQFNQDDTKLHKISIGPDKRKS